MKSLESLEIINNCLEELDYEHKEDTNIWRYDLEVIKKDLEILELVRGKSFFFHLSKQELKKVNKWLEENENDR